MRIAVTGATGFVGGALLHQATAAGHELRALARRPQPITAGVTWIAGALDMPAALDDLVRGSDAVIHIAGTLRADRAGFVASNIDGTRAMIAAATRAEIKRFIHVSSLAAREPHLSNYGWSKAGAEALVAESPLAWDMVRPPAVYGPGDREMLDLFKLAKYRLALLPPSGRLSVIHVDDLARLLLALAAAPATRRVYEVDDSTPGGWRHRDFARAIGTAVGRRVATVAMPRFALDLGARLDTMLRGGGAKLTPDRVAYFCHPDWVSDPAQRPDANLWQPAIATPAGLAATAAAYRAAGWL